MVYARRSVSFVSAVEERAYTFLRLLDSYTSKLSRNAKPQVGANDPFVGLLPWELTTKEALEVPRSDEQTVDYVYAAKLLDFTGYVKALQTLLLPPYIVCEDNALDTVIAITMKAYDIDNCTL
jgi:hypothetical protein